MNRTTSPRSGQIRRRMAAMVIGITASTAALGPIAPAQAADAVTCRIGPRVERIEARRDLSRVVDEMPAGWRATEVMSRQLHELLGNDDDCDRRGRVVELMPAGWPATEVMRRGIES